MIVIEHESGLIGPSDLEIAVDNLPVTAVFEPGRITLTPEVLRVGTHMLKIRQRSDHLLRVKSVLINHCSMGDTIYLSYGMDEGRRIQPLTELYKPGIEWYLPFGFPMIRWLDLVASKFRHYDLGSNLYEKYDIYYPVPKDIDDRYPQLVRDFFAYDFDFTVVDKNTDNHRLIPYTPAEFDAETVNALARRVEQYLADGSMEYILKTGVQDYQAPLDNANWKPGSWRYWHLVSFDKKTKTAQWNVTEEQWPEVWQIMRDHNITEVCEIRLAFLDPECYMYPHKDEEYNEQFAGACQYHIPLNFGKDNWLKIAGVGVFELSEGSRALNVSQYTHTVINCTKELRYALLLRCDLRNKK